MYNVLFDAADDTIGYDICLFGLTFLFTASEFFFLLHYGTGTIPGTVLLQDCSQDWII